MAFVSGVVYKVRNRRGSYGWLSSATSGTEEASCEWVLYPTSETEVPVSRWLFIECHMVFSPPNNLLSLAPFSLKPRRPLMITLQLRPPKNSTNWLAGSGQQRHSEGRAAWEAGRVAGAVRKVHPAALLLPFLPPNRPPPSSIPPSIPPSVRLRQL